MVFSRIFVALILLASGFLAFGLSLPAYAEDAVIEVQVSGTGKNAEEAKKNALENGEKEALSRYFQSQTHGASSVTIDPNVIAQMLKGYEILEEKSAATTYSATLRYTFNPAPASSIKKPSAETPAAPVDLTKLGRASLILPLWQGEGARMLWEANNPWAYAWQRVALTREKGDVVVPAGDLIDTEYVDASTVEGVPFMRLAPMLVRYGAGEALLAFATTNAEQTEVTVQLKRLTAKGESQGKLQYNAMPNEKLPALLKRAATDLSLRLAEPMESAWEPPKPKETDEKQLRVTVEAKRAEDLATLRMQLRRVKNVTRADVLSVSTSNATLQIGFTGTAKNLLDNLNAQNLTLIKRHEEWFLENVE